ncbi:FecCD family ABC transporter permease [Nocardia sp. NBC_01329]|uniref:FecCD family ABC transporter permease n=1 Tax=Nocardia sp. NBC_01329 TaxID=2903594 RepID=UPI002E144C18|nr:iron chelate uptake ABC transporter family permease subunit [Nocardia sp. NBC_01329]
MLVTAILVVAILIVAVTSLVVRGAGVAPSEAFGVFTGNQDGFPATVVLQWRLPRVLAAIVIGAALGVAGAIFQSLTRNPLGSPDVIGFNTGAYTGVLVVIFAGAGSFAATAAGAIAGGTVAAAAVYLLCLRSGSTGLRMVVVGLGISAALTAANRWLIRSAELETSMAAATWGAGTLNGLRWPQVVPGVLALLVLIAAAGLSARRLDLFDMGDEAAQGLGLPLRATQLWLMMAGVGLTACSTALAGPISFVALAAPHIARALTRGSRMSLAPIAATGALILVVADLAAQRLFAPTQLPVGVVTVTIGGIYLVTLLAQEARR